LISSSAIQTWWILKIFVVDVEVKRGNHTMSSEKELMLSDTTNKGKRIDWN